MHFNVGCAVPGSVRFMNNVFQLSDGCTLLGVDVTSDIVASVKKFTCKFMNMFIDFRHMQYDVYLEC